MAGLSEEQTMLRDGAKAWAAERSPIGAFRKLRDGKTAFGFDPAIWREMGEMGWAGVLVPEDQGGSAFGYRSLGLVLEETGRTLTASPLVSTALVGATALMLGGTAAQKAEWLPKIAQASVVVALALEERAHHAPERTALKAAKRGDGWLLNGKKGFVLDGMAADLLIVVARGSGQPGEESGLTLFLVDPKATGVTRRALNLIDSRGAAEVSFADAPVGADAVLGRADHGFELLEPILDRARAGLAAEMVGTAAQAFEVTLDYLKTRTQFGQVIGTFQALQHRAAKMFAALEAARSCVYAALDAIDENANDVRALASLAKAKADDVLHLVSNEMVQMHGGIGMTDAADAGLYIKRARAAEATFGSAAYHRDRYARLNGF